MVQIGKFNRLMILGCFDTGVSLDGGKLGEIWLPSREVSRTLKVSDKVDVFVYHDSDNKLIATVEKPFVIVGEFASLVVTAIEEVGAFLDWGLAKDLFLPFREQTRKLIEGDTVTVAVYLDKSERISASMRVEKFLDPTPQMYQEGEPVDLLIASETDLGFKAIVNQRHIGIIYKNEVFQHIKLGQAIEGYIKFIREDGKIDLTLNKPGHEAADEIGQKILRLLETRGGFLPVGDKSSAEVIYDLFGASKKKFKMAIGKLYKQKRITIEDDGIRLN